MSISTNIIFMLGALIARKYIRQKTSDDGSWVNLNQVIRWRKKVQENMGELPSVISEYDIMAIIAIESAGNPDAVGDNGHSFGLMQFQHGAFLDSSQWLGVSYSFDDAKFDPDKNIEIGAAYLKIKMGEWRNELDYAVMSYNKGTANIQRQKEPEYSQALEYLAKFVREKRAITKKLRGNN